MTVKTISNYFIDGVLKIINNYNVSRVIEEQIEQGYKIEAVIPVIVHKPFDACEYDFHYKIVVSKND